MAMAYSVVDIEAFCNGELEQFNNNCRKRKAPRKRKKQKEFPSIPEMPAATRERIADMGGYEIQLVIQKQLQDTDLNKNHGRLSLPTKKLLVDFAIEEERRLLKGMNVLIIDPLLRDSIICFKKWKIGSRDVYCLMTQWNSFVQQNNLKTGEYIQIWCFRRDEFEPQTQTIASRCLCFAMVNLSNTASA